MTGGVPLEDSEVLPVFEALAPLVSDAVGDVERVELALSVLEGVAAGVPLAVAVPVPLVVCEGDCVAVMLPVSEVLGVALGDTPADRDTVADADVVELPLSVEAGVAAGVPVPLAVGL